MLTHDKLRERVDYNPETGVFTSLVKARKVGTIMSCGYLRIQIDRKSYLAHRLAFLYMNGAFPLHQVDHINLDRGDTRWANLREATQSDNSSNKRAFSNNKSKLKGVCYHKLTGKWQATIRKNKVTHYLGLHDCPAAASFRYQIEADKLHRQFARVF